MTHVATLIAIAGLLVSAVYFTRHTDCVSLADARWAMEQLEAERARAARDLTPEWDTDTAWAAGYAHANGIGRDYLDWLIEEGR